MRRLATVSFALVSSACFPDPKQVDTDSSTQTDGEWPECDPVPGFAETIGQDPGTGRCYRVVAEPMSWPEAAAECLRLDSQIVSVNRNSEQIVVAIVLSMADLNGAWIGLSRPMDGDPFEWADGTPVEYDAWEDGQPNETGPDICAYARLQSGWNWHDDHCGGRYPFVCEWAP